jgi:hypothetical protein
MKKAISILLCITICFLLCACNSETSTTSNTSVSSDDISQKPKGNKANINTDLLKEHEGVGRTPAQAFIFDSYDRFLAHFSKYANKENSMVPSYKGNHGEKVRTFFDELIAKEHIEFPHIDNKLAPLDGSIYVFPYAQVIEYFLDFEDTRIFVGVRYPHIEEHEDFSEDLSASEILELIDSSAINANNFEKYKGHEDEIEAEIKDKTGFVTNLESRRYKAVYEKEIRISDRTLSAIVYECEEEYLGWMAVKFYYEGMFIYVRMEKHIYNSDFLEHFSMQ